jgi:hypothetical protein
MERSARRRRIRTVWPVLAAGLVCVGCVASTVGFDAGPPQALASEDAFVLPAGLETPHFAAAKRDTTGPKKGPGLAVAYQTTVFGDWRTKATDAVPSSPLSYGQYGYRDLFDNAHGISVSLILRRPQTGTLNVGDTYMLGCFDFQRYAGREWVGTGGPVTFDPLEQTGVWLEAKTMLKPLGRSTRPYVRYGGGIVFVGEVGADVSEFWSSGPVAGVRGGFGIDIAFMFLDIGIRVVGAPDAVRTDGVGRAEPLVATPMRVGILLNF